VAGEIQRKLMRVDVDTDWDHRLLGELRPGERA
jgi:hypothetical protein